MYVGSTGQMIEFDLFGQKLKTSNTGLAIIFLGIVVVVLLVRRVLRTLDVAVSTQGKVAIHTPPIEPKAQQPNQEPGPSLPWVESEPAFANVPDRNPYFTGRDDLLEQIRATLESDGRVALSALGGLGKTQIAVEYAYRYRDCYKHVLWSRAESRDSLESHFLTLATLLKLPEKDEMDLHLIVAALRRWLENNNDWLLILDNADDLALAREFIPRNANGHVLLTTRAYATGQIPGVEIQEMEQGEAALFLLRRTKAITRVAQLNAATDQDRTLAEEISKLLDALPLALDQAGAFIEETPSSLSEYLSIYRREGPKLLAKRGDLASDHPSSVTITFTLAFRKVAERSPAAADLIRLCAFLGSDVIPEEIFTRGASELGELLGPAAANPLQFTEAVKEAGRFSLIRRNVSQQTMDIHRLVQEVLKEEMDEDTFQLWGGRALRAVNQVFPARDYENWSTCERLLPHAIALKELVDGRNLESEVAARLLNRTGLYLYERAKYTEAEPLYQRSLTMREKVLGPEHLGVAQSLNNLAALYDSQARYSEAAPLYQRGPGHLGEGAGA